MRVGLWRWLICAAVFVPVVALSAPAQPPGFEKNGSDPAAERAKLQAELLLLLKRINTAPTAPMPYPASPMPSPGPKPKADSGVGTKGLDPVREAMNLFRDNDFEGARRILQLIDPTVLPREDRAFVRYLTACCFRRQGRAAEAEVIYREVANSGDDEFLESCAKQQLSLMRSEQELQGQVEQLRARAKSK